MRKSGPEHPKWKGGRWIDKAGYVYVRAPEHPTVYANGFYPEHRLVVEKAIGRSLSRDEHVHHRDGDKQNNDLSNLEVLTAREHGLLHPKQPQPHCRRGHPWTPESTGINHRGVRFCRICRRDWNRQDWALNAASINEKRRARYRQAKQGG